MFKLICCFITILTFTQSYAETRYASYNIRNFDYDERSRVSTNKNHLIHIIKELNPDLMAIQEINAKTTFYTMIENSFQGKFKAVLSKCGGAHGQKLGFVYAVKRFKLISFEEDLRTTNVNNPTQGLCHEGSRPLAIATFKDLKNGLFFTAISVHLKSGSRPKSIKKRFKQIAIISKVIQEKKQKGLEHFVVMGDFNSTQYGKGNKRHEQFVRLVSQMGATDSARDLNCSSYWWGNRDDSTQYPSMLDHILISNSLIQTKKFQTSVHGHCRKLQCQASLEAQMGISFDEVSDHCPILTKI